MGFFKKNPVLSKLIFSGILIILILIMQPLQILHLGEKIAVLFPKGLIAYEERNLIFIVQALMLLVVIPVYVMTFIFSWIYRADKKNGKYDPNFTDNFFAECLWWGIPLVMVGIVSILTWIYTYQLDPFAPIKTSSNKEKTIQVVALQWKWLFIYPEEKIATLNFLQIPKDTPIRFELTADAPMNSFWIPQLGGQIYAMPGMKTLLHLIANDTGDFRGSSANISGEGFSGMHFIAKASTQEEYDAFVAKAKESSGTLDQKRYEELAKPSQNNPKEVFKLGHETLFEQIVNQYMHNMRT
jgi:cytochrome o ubiquinol oxidase subunit 2